MRALSVFVVMAILAGCVTGGGTGVPLTRAQKAKQAIVMSRLAVSTSIAAIGIMTESDDPEKMTQIQAKLTALLDLANATLIAMESMASMNPEISEFAAQQASEMKAEVATAVAEFSSDSP